MKFHLTLDGKNAVCGAVANRPDTFLYDKAGFASHYASEYKCKKCSKIFNEMKDDKKEKGGKAGDNVGKIKESIKDIQSVERYLNFSIRGNAHQIKSDDADFGQMMDDYSVYLTDKEFLQKWAEKLIGKGATLEKYFDVEEDGDFDENGLMEEFRVTEEYYITFKDGSEISVDWSVPDANFLSADSRDAEVGTMANKYIREYEMDGWDIDIDSIVEEVSADKKMAKGGEATGLKVENEKDLEEVAKYMVKAVKKHSWDLKDLIYYFEQDNGFDYKVRDKIAPREAIYEMPKTYDNILKLLKEIVEGNGKKLSMGKGGLTPAKARIMLHEGKAHGKNITDKQRRYFGAVASGSARKEKGGEADDMNYEKDILPVLQSATEQAWESVAKKYRLYEENAREIENKSRAGFIPFTDGGYHISAYNTAQEFDGTGLKMPTDASQKVVDKWISECHEEAKEKTGSDEGEEFSDEYSECVGGISVDFAIKTIYFNPENNRNEFKPHHAISIFGIINDNSIHEDSHEEMFHFDNIEELEEKLPVAMNKVLSWFKVDTKMAKGGKVKHDSSVSDINWLITG